LELGIAEGRFCAGNVLVTRDIILGSIFFGIETMLTEPSHVHHIEEMLCTVLRESASKKREAHKIAFAPLPDIGAISGPIFSALVAGTN
jgi:hypothetical protein